MNLLFLIAASLAFSAGGLAMKLSDGLAHARPAALMFVLFAAGAALQAFGMRRLDLSVGYVFVLGLEAAVTAVLSVGYLHEALPPQRLAAIVVVVAGIVWLRAS